MSDVNDRIKELRTTLKLSQRSFAERIFISQSLYADMELGKVSFKERFIQLISSQFNISIDWIKTGEGEMFTAPPPDFRLEYLIDIFNQLDPLLQDYVLLHLKELLNIQRLKIDTKKEDD
jgi:transcriptional regulator with XRE-family HTH domain